MDKTQPLSAGSVEQQVGPDTASMVASGAQQPTVIYPGIRAPATAVETNELDVDLIGTRLDHYVIHSLLGRGAMGSVYLGWHERLHRLCAVKVLTSELVRDDPRRLEMFLNEARSAARLCHPNIVAVHSLGEDRGYHFIEMEYVEGVSLGRRVLDEGRLPSLVATRVMGQAAAGLAAAHGCGVVHCDLKPDNIMLAHSGTAKLTDFGLAKIFGGADVGSGRTVGTPPFMAPELFDGTENTTAADVFALGATYYMLLTGETPFPAKTMEQLRARHAEAIPDPSGIIPDLPQPIRELVLELLAKSPADRPAANAALVARFESVATGLVDTEELVRQAMEDLDVDWEGTGERFCFTARLPGGRRQTVWAEVVEAERGTERLMSFWTPCGPAAPEHYACVLELNSRLPFGAIGVHQCEGRPYFVIVENLHRATLDPEEIRAAVRHLAEWADAIELKLTNRDVH
jgi:serine/threonine-protein kinase